MLLLILKQLFCCFCIFYKSSFICSALGTKYLNEIFTITREVKDKVTNVIQTTADYSELGLLLITVTVLTLIVPILFVNVIQKTKFKTNE